MNSTFTPTRRAVLQTLLFTGTTVALGGFPNLSYSAEGGHLNIRFEGDVESLDPFNFVGGHPANDINWAIMPALVHYAYSNGEANWTPSPYTESVTILEPTRIEFKLKKGLMWTNGFGELSSADVAYTFDRYKDSERQGGFSNYAHTEIVDDHTGVLVLKEAFAPFMNSTLANGSGIIVCKAAVEANGGSFTTDPLATCGPYTYSSEQGQHVTLKRNPDWTGEPAAFDTIKAIIVADEAAAALAFEANEIDSTKITSNTYARYKKNAPENSSLKVAGALQYMWMGMNTEHPKLQDIRVRKAIQHAIDQDSIIQGAYAGVAEPSHGVVCPGLLGKRNASGYDYNPQKARDLLAEAGVSDLTVTLRTLNKQERVLAAQIIQANLQAVGVKLEILPMDGGPFWEMGQEAKGETWKDLELWLMRFGGGPDPWDCIQWFTREQIGIWNWERWSSEEFDALYAQGLAETDSDIRRKLYVRMQEIMEESGAYVWMVHEAEVYVTRDNLNSQFSPTGESMLTYFNRT